MFTEPTDSETPSAHEEQRVQAIVAAGSAGAMTLAGVAVALVLAMWLAFYLFVFLPRG